NSLTDFPRTLCFVLIFVVQFSMTSLPALADSSIIIPRSSLFVNPFFEIFFDFFIFSFARLIPRLKTALRRRNLP
ncbi:MAG: hypothetical protein SPJ77_07800, partial [Eubacteriales bacterium]|nr:hypothetical protein [Eubacteriales bacterium]